MKRWIATLLLMAAVFIPKSVFAEGSDGEAVYRILDENGREITLYAGIPEAGDEYIAGDNSHFRVTAVDADNLTASAHSLGSYELPDVKWLTESARPVTAPQKAVALYCTHSDESYEPTDGASSLEQRGGIYDVAESFKTALEKEGITVYYSDENHYPHDAGAYRRSRATAASLVEEGVDAIMDVHRDGIPDAAQYEKTMNGEDITKVRLLVGRSNQNAEANKAFAAQIKAVGDEVYPGLIKDIYIGKGTYNQDLMSQAVLLEFGTYTNDKEAVLTSTGYMADVMNKTLYGGVTGAADSGAAEDAGAWKGIGWLIGALIIGVMIYAFAATGRGRDAMGKFKRSFQEMTGGLGSGDHDGPKDE
ncbi:MAG: stage II sporulation protein P [Clostridia bacterium]|nr:stage II sporulation protein P [Clostridia bacterium]